MYKALIAAAAAGLTSSALAGTTLVGTEMDSVSIQPTNFDTTVSINQYNGVQPLCKVVITLEGFVTGSAAAESTDAAPATIELDLQSTITLSDAVLGSLVEVIPLANESFGATVYDGTIDFDGTSGVAFTDLAGDATNDGEFTDAPTLALFTGAGSVVLDVDAIGSSVASGAGNIISQFSSNAGVDIKVEYFVDTVIPAPGAAFGGVMGLGALAMRRRR